MLNVFLPTGLPSLFRRSDAIRSVREQRTLLEVIRKHIKTGEDPPSVQPYRLHRGLKPLPGGNTWTDSEGTRALASGTTPGSTPTSRLGVESSRECSGGWTLGGGGGERRNQSAGTAVNISCKLRWAAVGQEINAFASSNPDTQPFSSGVSCASRVQNNRFVEAHFFFSKFCSRWLFFATARFPA